MESKIEILIIALFVLVVVLFILVINANMKYNRLKFSYNSFMKGKDGRTLEDSIFERFEELDNLTEMTIKNRQAIRKINEEMMSNFQKVGIVKYDAFNEMGGKLSFAITLLDGNNSGYIINSMHSREGCYNYIKEIVKDKIVITTQHPNSRIKGNTDIVRQDSFIKQIESQTQG